MVVSDEMLSAHSNKMWRDIHDHYTSEIKRTKTSKLIPNLYNKKNYVVHYRSLKQYISLGVKLTKIHRVLEFSQAAFLKPYIDLNTAKRIQAKNDWEKHFYKLMNNAVFGKTLENLRNRVDVKLAHTEKKLNKLVAKSFLKRFEILNENLIIFEFEKVTLLLKRPIYIGQAVLEISKTIMYNFHYNYIKRKFGDRVQLCFTDTDSFLYDIKSVDVYEEIALTKIYLIFLIIQIRISCSI